MATFISTDWQSFELPSLVANDIQPCYPISLILLHLWTRVKIFPWNNSMLKITSEKRARSSHGTDNFCDLKMLGAQTADKLTIYLIQLLEKLIYTDKIYISSLLLKSWWVSFIIFIVLHSFKQSSSSLKRVSWLKYQKPCLTLILWLQPSFNISVSHSSWSAKHSKWNSGYILSRTHSVWSVRHYIRNTVKSQIPSSVFLHISQVPYWFPHESSKRS